MNTNLRKNKINTGEFEVKDHIFGKVFTFSHPSFGNNSRGAEKLFEVGEDCFFSSLGFSFDECMLLKSERGVLRGMHYQTELCKRQDRIITVLTGKIYVAVVDVVKERDTYGNWKGVSLSPEKRTSIYIPGEYAIGTLAEEDSLFLMFYSGSYTKGFERGFRYDDETIGIIWPKMDRRFSVSEKDLVLPSFCNRSI